MKYEYLSNTPLEKAVTDYLNSLKSSGTKYKTESIIVRNANKRVNANAVYAKRCSPHYCASAMDGIALKAALTNGASEGSPVTISKNDYVIVDTGDPLPTGCDCVVMIEDVIFNQDESVQLYKASVPWNNVRQIGEDICMGDMIIPSFTQITPALIGALLAGGINELEVIRKPVVAIIPTGDEIVDCDKELSVGDIPEYNSAIFSAMLSDWGAEVKVYPITPDIPDKLKSTVSSATEECDVIIVIAGSSAGRDDYTSSILKELGTLTIHGLAIKPGKPAVLGNIGTVPFIGVPGYPVSGIIVMEQVVKQVISYLTKITYPPQAETDVELSRKLTSSLKYKEYIRCRSSLVLGKKVAVPMSRGAGIVSGFAKASGMITIPQNSEGVNENSTVSMRLLRPYSEICNSLCVTGSHDPLIDEISDILIRSDSPVYVVSSHVGSMGAIMALKNKEAHLGGIHLLDTQTGTYNKSYVNKYFTKGEVTLIRGVIRKQGLMVAKGNPLGFKSINDIARKGVSYVNRQKGSGTRILLDYLINKNDISTNEIYGYSREEYTHTSVAAIISSGNADVGMGIYSAAKIYSLDFVPLWDEEYDFIVLTDALKDQKVRLFIDVLKGVQFRNRLNLMGGYTCENCGEIITL